VNSVQTLKVFDIVLGQAADANVKWNADANCAIKATTSYGLMLFREQDADQIGSKELNFKHVHAGKPYVRVSATDCTKHPEWIRDMLVNKWDLDPPRILLAVTGGAMAFDLPPKLDEMIKIGKAYGARFSTRSFHSRVPLSFTPLLRLKRCHACDQCHSSRVFTPLTSCHCEVRPNTNSLQKAAKTESHLTMNSVTHR
jgi:hypothetical protein